MRSIFRGERFRYVSPRYFRYLAHTVYVTPFIMGIASAYLFAAVPQMQEIYLGIIEDRDLTRGFSGLAVISLFSALLYAWNHRVVTGRIDDIYPDHADIYFDRGVIGVRDLKTAFVASLPFLGLFLGLVQVHLHVQEARTLIAHGSASLPQASALRASLPGLSAAVSSSMAIVVAVYLGLIALFLLYLKESRWQRPLLLFCYALAVVLTIVPVADSGVTLLGARGAGPLTSTALVLIEVAVLMRLLFWAFARTFSLILTLPSAFLISMDWMPNRLRQALVALIPLIIVGVIAAQALFSTVTRTETQHRLRGSLEDVVASAFSAWLKARNTGQDHYPVFILAAQGGGIYAASSTAAFLASMQDHCPTFASHVFAISAVSGGSVGASLFNAALAEAPSGSATGCTGFMKQGPLTQRLQAITQDDHMSPVIAYLLPDVVRGIFSPERSKVCTNEKGIAWLGRDQILEKSFIYSFTSSRPDGKTRKQVCPEPGDKIRLCSPRFSQLRIQQITVPLCF